MVGALMFKGDPSFNSTGRCANDPGLDARPTDAMTIGFIGLVLVLQPWIWRW